jgi:hypothetical protein
MQMRVTRSKRWVRRHQLRFEGLSETSGDAARPVFVCPRTGKAKSLAECMRCPSFVNIRPRPERHQITMRCLCTDDDPVVRSVHPGDEWPAVGPEVPLVAARRLAWAHDASVMLVARADELLGVVYEEHLSDARSPVATHMTEFPWALSARSTIGDAVEAMAAVRVPALLLVAPDSRLVGVISRRQLLRLGVPPERLA